jgi:hypothetical protein
MVENNVEEIGPIIIDFLLADNIKARPKFTRQNLAIR